MGELIIKLKDRKGGRNYALRCWFDNGRQVTRTLKDCIATAPKLAQEPLELQLKVEKEKSKALKNIYEEGPVPTGRFKSCRKAMETFSVWQDEHTKDDKTFYYAKKFIDRFGDEPLSRLTREAVGDWIEDLMAEGYGYNSVRLMLANCSRMISWMDEEGKWNGKNPFRGMMKRYKGRFPAVEPQGLLLSDADIEVILTKSKEKGLKAAETFVMIAVHTGLRPSEILRIDAKKINHTELTWNYLVTKTQSRQFYRKIPIPQNLASFIANHEEMQAEFPYTKWAVRSQIERLREITGLHFTMKTFRKIFAHMMENAAAAPEIINLMQGRGQHGVLFEHYLTDPNRATRLCRPYVDAMFGERGKMVRVK